LLAFLTTLSMLFDFASRLYAADRVEMRRAACVALSQLYSISPTARHVGESARAVLVFPCLVKGGADLRLHGSGTLFEHGTVVGYYKAVVASYSMPKRMQKFGYALFFMSDDDLAHLRKSGEWEIGTAPKVVVTDEKQKRKEQAATASASASANEVVTIAPSAATIIAHASEVTHRPAMNDQQEPAPRPNGLTLDPKYRGFIPIPNTGLTRTLTPTTQRDGVYAFAFGRTGLINGLRLQGTKITPVHPD
jgi:predicted transcriptional regulator with HTH domain